jgi:hypothetical protein
MIQARQTKALDAMINIPRFPTLSTATPRKGATPAEIKKGKLASVGARVSEILNSIVNILGVFYVYGKIEQ